MSHAYFEDLLPAYLDGDLAEAERRRVQDHLVGCLVCRELLANLRRLETMVVRQPGLPPPMRPALARVDANVYRYLRARRRPPLAAQIVHYGWRLTAATVPLVLMGVIALLVVLLGGPVLRARLSSQTAHLASPSATAATQPLADRNPTSSRGLAAAPAARPFAAASAATSVGSDSVTSADSPRASAPSAVIRTLPAPIVSLAPEPDNNQRIYALLATDTLYRSDDAGETWQPLPLPLLEHTSIPPASADENPVYLASQSDVVVPPGQPSRVFVAAAHVLYRSDDQGATWVSVHDAVTSWAVADARGNDLYVWHDPTTSADRGLYRSTDAGRTWAEVYSGAFPPALAGQHCPCSREGIIALAVDPGSPEILYAGTDFGVYRSLDGGKTWSDLDQGMPTTALPYRSTPLLAVASDGTVYAVTDVWTNPTVSHAALIRLRPGESVWTDVGGDAFAALQDANQAFHGINALAIDPTTPGRLYLGTSTGLAVSDDAGSAWKKVDLPIGKAVFRVVVVNEKGAESGMAAPVLDLGTDDGFLRISPAS